MGHPISHDFPMYIVDVFAKEAFAGSPAAVCFLGADSDISDETKQKIAAEMNQSVTAFVSGPTSAPDTFSKSNEFHLRWFTPTMELGLCGHASLGTTSLLYDVYGNTHEQLNFRTKSGTLVASKKHGAFAIDFPQSPAVQLDLSTRVALQPLLDECNSMFGREAIVEVLHAPATRNLLIRLRDDVDLVNLQVDPSQFQAAHRPALLKLNGVIVTVKGSPKTDSGKPGNKEYDFISRYFAPWIGVPEDYVCGSAHTSLGPYWTAVLGKVAKNARQVSQRGGDLLLDIHGDRIEIAANCKLVMKGQLSV